ncbi:protein halfway isoform X2 [Euwallacea fornicatus]|uniref:protein halfway isoform X2 n=1 Tax=Euwallacea fornicatus TaxID=995702 RepID=UPI00338E462F
MYMRVWYEILYIIILIIKSTSLLAPDDSSCSNQCFYQLPEMCPPPKDTCRCHLLADCQKAAICCDVNHFTLTEGLACVNITSNNGIEALHIRNATFDTFNLTSSQSVLRLIRYLTITDGNISRIEGEFAKHSRVSCLNLSSNHINTIENRSLATLYTLSVLDLSHNNLTEVPNIRKGSVSLNISNNKNLICSKLKNTLLIRPEITFNNENDTFCITSKDFVWFKTAEILPFLQVKAMHELQNNCHHNCSCETYRLNLSPEKLSTIEVAMNCSGKKFHSLPVPLPVNTIYLDVSNNKITSIKELSDPSYQNLRNFIADNNRISSIQPLEGTKFISNFNTLSLQRNDIRVLETYVLDNIQFERNYNQRKVKLGFNKIHCDCNTMKLKVWLLSKLSHIPDYDDIKCHNMNSKVIELDAAKMCQSPQDWTDFIYYIITAEVLLFVGLVAKVSYDYWVFKTAGYLPWPANKMPRLPCDWLCE